MVAAPVEARAVRSGLGLAPTGSGADPERYWEVERLADRMEMVVCGIGKANAAGATARAVRVERHELILNVGIGGLLPAPVGPDAPRTEPRPNSRPAGVIGGLWIATSSVFADDGVETPDGWLTCRDIGFPIVDGAAVRTGRGLDGIAADERWLRLLGPLADHQSPIATVSACSGTDAAAERIAARTGARLEAMEGAAVGLVAWRLGVPFIEVRAASNTTGDRSRQEWDVAAAAGRLSQFIRELSALFDSSVN